MLYEVITFADPWYSKGLALRNLGRYEEALKALEKSIELDPKFAYPWHGKGNVFRITSYNVCYTKLLRILRFLF